MSVKTIRVELSLNPDMWTNEEKDLEAVPVVAENVAAELEKRLTAAYPDSSVSVTTTSNAENKYAIDCDDEEYDEVKRDVEDIESMIPWTDESYWPSR